MTDLTKPSTHQVTIKKRQEIAKGTIAFYFDRPPGFMFQAGQFIDLTLPNLSDSDPQSRTRAFTLASAPSEQQLMVATRIRDTPFKRLLSEMPLASPVEIEGPFGRFTLPDHDSRTLVFLAGGIGITPFRSMLIEATRHKLPFRFVLMYSNRRPEDVVFLDELQLLQQEHHNITCIGTITNPEGGITTWKGETGRIDETMLKKYVEDTETAMYYVVGPPAMVDGLQKMLESAGIHKNRICAEEFVGY
jgi:ferredoxin-NADP reductase